MHITITPNEVYALVTAGALIAAIGFVLFDVLRQMKKTVRESYSLATTSEQRSYWILVRAMARLIAPALLINVALGERWLWRSLAPSPESAWFHKPISSLRDGVDTFLVGARLLLWNAAQLEIAMVIVVLGGAAVVLLVRTDLPADASAALGRGRDSLRRGPVPLYGPVPMGVGAADSGVRPEGS
ncbi:hypothetical protein [Mycobacteroides chelonae]|uniref:hypothetical protein n=1 Tax=Mycobacteroides chelonae TaxID=1774 RepID=UPI000993BB29|nr:hypothetical protein [Mycobacteroides chelonae]